MNYQLSEGYRSSRKATSIFCALGLAWSALQFELKALSSDIFGKIDLSNASIPLILISLIGYNGFRSAIEFIMQPVEIRRWKYAQIDFQLSFWLVQSALILLSASAVHRSFDTIFYVAIATVAIPILLGASTLLLAVIFIPIYMFTGHLRGRRSVASMAIEATTWLTIIIFLAYISLIATGAFLSVTWEPLSSLWAAPPSPYSLVLFVITITLVSLCILSHRRIEEFSFSMQNVHIEKDNSGRPVRMTIGERPPTTSEWYMEPTKANSETPENPQD